MLVHEARTRFTGRAPVFGDPHDRQALALLALYHQAAAKAKSRHKTPERLAKKLNDFQQADATTLGRYLDPPLAGRRRRGYGR